jgi:hypothetical protein
LALNHEAPRIAKLYRIFVPTGVFDLSRLCPLPLAILRLLLLSRRFQMLQRWLLKGKKIFRILRRLSGPTKSEHPARRSESVPRKQSDARKNSPFFKIAFAFKRCDHVVSLIVNANDSII